MQFIDCSCIVAICEFGQLKCRDKLTCSFLTCHWLYWKLKSNKTIFCLHQQSCGEVRINAPLILSKIKPNIVHHLASQRPFSCTPVRDLKANSFMLIEHRERKGITQYTYLRTALVRTLLPLIIIIVQLKNFRIPFTCLPFSASFSFPTVCFLEYHTCMLLWDLLWDGGLAVWRQVPVLMMRIYCKVL